MVAVVAVETSCACLMIMCTLEASWVCIMALYCCSDTSCVCHMTSWAMETSEVSLIATPTKWLMMAYWLESVIE